MRFKATVILSFLTVKSSWLLSLGPQSERVLSETPETRTIAALLKVHQAYDANGPIQLRRIGKEYDGGYIIPEVAVQKADVVLGYGIGYDISFEDSATAIYGKPSYGFDCAYSPIMPSQEQCHFVSSCIVGKEFTEQSSNLESFDRHLDRVGARDKKLFVKISGGAYQNLYFSSKHSVIASPYKRT